MKWFFWIGLWLIAVTAHVTAGNPDALLGIWLNEEGTAKIEIYKDNGKFYGKIVWLKDPVYTEHDVAINAGNPKVKLGVARVDWKNPDIERQNDPILGLVVLRGFVYDTDDDEWNAGMIYDPKKGSDYKCFIKMPDPDKIKLRGYVGFSLIGRTTYWTRTKV